MPSLYRLPNNHKKVFKDNIPVSMPYLMRTLFNYWEINDLNPKKLFTDSCINHNEKGIVLNKLAREFFMHSGKLYLCLFFERNLVSKKKEKRIHK